MDRPHAIALNGNGIVAPSPREGGGYLTRSADTMSVAAADNGSYADGTVVSRRIIASLTEASPSRIFASRATKKTKCGSLLPRHTL